MSDWTWVPAWRLGRTQCPEQNLGSRLLPLGHLPSPLISALASSLPLQSLGSKEAAERLVCPSHSPQPFLRATVIAKPSSPAGAYFLRPLKIENITFLFHSTLSLSLSRSAAFTSHRFPVATGITGTRTGKASSKHGVAGPWKEGRGQQILSAPYLAMSDHKAYPVTANLSQGNDSVIRYTTNNGVFCRKNIYSGN